MALSSNHQVILHGDFEVVKLSVSFSKTIKIIIRLVLLFQKYVISGAKIRKQPEMRSLQSDSLEINIDHHGLMLIVCLVIHTKISLGYRLVCANFHLSQIFWNPSLQK